MSNEPAGHAGQTEVNLVFRSSGAVFRLEIKGDTWTTSDSATAKLEVRGEEGSACAGSVQYGEEYQLISSTTTTLHLDTSSAEAATWDKADTTTRLHIEPSQ